MTLVIGTAFSIFLLILTNHLASQGDANKNWANSIYLELASYFIYKVIIPITYLAKRRDVRNFIWNDYFTWIMDNNVFMDNSVF